MVDNHYVSTWRGAFFKSLCSACQVARSPGRAWTSKQGQGAGAEDVQSIAGYTATKKSVSASRHVQANPLSLTSHLAHHLRSPCLAHKVSSPSQTRPDPNPTQLLFLTEYGVPRTSYCVPTRLTHYLPTHIGTQRRTHQGPSSPSLAHTHTWAPLYSVQCSR